ncbi:hypothetical protein TWF694_004902 [Orbilia ellipsospora]|uniref:Uncharacterized protein n=1 Tax=Orbilia ellipsospora TaxID=2528407 RepID=A0AAV9WU32_9PEZI
MFVGSTWMELAIPEREKDPKTHASHAIISPTWGTDTFKIGQHSRSVENEKKERKNKIT